MNETGRVGKNITCVITVLRFIGLLTTGIIYISAPNGIGAGVFAVCIISIVVDIFILIYVCNNYEYAPIATGVVALIFLSIIGGIIIISSNSSSSSHSPSSSYTFHAGGVSTNTSSSVCQKSNTYNKTITCPSCGYVFVIDSNLNKCFCQCCGQEIVIEGESQVDKHKQPFTLSRTKLIDTGKMYIDIKDGNHGDLCRTFVRGSVVSLKIDYDEVPAGSYGFVLGITKEGLIDVQFNSEVKVIVLSLFQNYLTLENEESKSNEDKANKKIVACDVKVSGEIIYVNDEQYNMKYITGVLFSDNKVIFNFYGKEVTILCSTSSKAYDLYNIISRYSK